MVPYAIVASLLCVGAPAKAPPDAAAATLDKTKAAHACGCYQNDVDNDLYAVMCSVNSGTEGPPSAMVGWGRPRRKWEAATCADCQLTFGKHNCTDIVKPAPAPKPFTVSTTPAEHRPLAAAAPSKPTLGDEDFHLCCAYARKDTSYTDYISAPALNSGIPTCTQSEFGSDYLGHWYVYDMFDQECFFVTLRTPGTGVSGAAAAVR